MNNEFDEDLMGLPDSEDRHLARFLYRLKMLRSSICIISA